MHRKSKNILTLNNLVEANLLESILTEKGIPHYIRSYHDPAYDGIWQEQKGWGHVEAPGEYEQTILDIYKDIRQQ